MNKFHHTVIDKYRILNDREWNYVIRSSSKLLEDFLTNRIMLAPTKDSTISGEQITYKQLFQKIKKYVSNIIINDCDNYKGMVYIDHGSVDTEATSNTDIFVYNTVRVYFSKVDDKEHFLTSFNTEHRKTNILSIT